MLENKASQPEKQGIQYLFSFLVRLSARWADGLPSGANNRNGERERERERVEQRRLERKERCEESHDSETETDTQRERVLIFT